MMRETSSRSSTSCACGLALRSMGFKDGLSGAASNTPEHGCQGRAQLVRDCREKLILCPVRLLRFAVESRVVDGQGGAAREVFGVREVCLRVLPTGFGGHEGNRAQRAPASDQRNDHVRLPSELTNEAQMLVLLRGFGA